ncbi:MAG: putative membrane protein [Paracoccaceae bacterium]|jgi:uncharacterized membrane protein
MGFLLLLLGMVLFVATHVFKLAAPVARERMGNAAKGLVTAGSIAGIIIIIIGYRSATILPVWSPPSFLLHLNNVLMLLAFYTFGASAAKGAKVWLGTKVRHPQLTAVKVWALAHLLVNGDLASIVLFGGMLIWAVGSVILINRTDGPWTVPARAPAKKEIVLVVITLVLFSVTAAIHTWLGYWPFPG